MGGTNTSADKQFRVSQHLIESIEEKNAYKGRIIKLEKGTLTQRWLVKDSKRSTQASTRMYNKYCKGGIRNKRHMISSLPCLLNS